MKLSNLVYLDTSFIVETYESIHDEPVPVKISRSETFSGGLTIPFINGGVSTTEIKEFPINTRQMHEKIRDVLLSIPTVKLRDSSPEKLPEYFWTNGIFGACQSQNWSDGRLINQGSHFCLYSEIGSLDSALNLVVNNGASLNWVGKSRRDFEV